MKPEYLDDINLASWFNLSFFGNQHHDLIKFTKKALTGQHLIQAI